MLKVLILDFLPFFECSTQELNSELLNSTTAASVPTSNNILPAIAGFSVVGAVTIYLYFGSFASFIEPFYGLNTCEIFGSFNIFSSLKDFSIFDIFSWFNFFKNSTTTTATSVVEIIATDEPLRVEGSSEIERTEVAINNVQLNDRSAKEIITRSNQVDLETQRAHVDVVPARNPNILFVDPIEANLNEQRFRREVAALSVNQQNRNVIANLEASTEASPVTNQELNASDSRKSRSSNIFKKNQRLAASAKRLLLPSSK